MTEANKQRYNLIQQYLDGSLDPGRMHELEKEALEDPFLAEALEGYAEFDGSLQPHLSLLQRQLEVRIAVNAEKKNMFFFTWQRISVAAAASLLFISASILFWMKGTNREVRMAGNSKNVEVTLTPDDKLGKEGLAAEKYTQNEAVIMEPESMKAFKQPQKETKIQQKSFSPQIASRRKVGQNYATKRGADGVKLNSAVDKPTGIIADGPLANKTLIASRNSYTPGSLARSTPIYAQQKTESSVLNEVSVVDSGNFHQKAVSTVSSFPSQMLIMKEENIEPVGGWENYQAYIRQNKRLPAPAEEEGSVTIAFTIDSRGKPDTCRIQKGMSESYNAEAIRLLKEGPLWKIMKPGRKNLGYIEVDFKN